MTPPHPAAPRTRSLSERDGARSQLHDRRESVSPLTVNRLSIYLRSLRTLQGRGIERVSSKELAREFHLSPTQIRKDLAQFGEFGVRGVGYEVAALSAKLATLLGLDLEHRLLIVGMGNLGTALARFPAFNSGSFRVVAAVDSDPAKIGRRISGISVAPMSELPSIVSRSGATMAILAVPASDAQAAFEVLVQAGLPAVLNFVPVSLPSQPACKVKNVDLRIQLEELGFYLAP